VFESTSSHGNSSPIPQDTPRKHRFLQEIFKKLSRFNLFATYVRKAPFDFIVQSPDDDFNILGGVTGRNEQNVDQRAKEILSVSKVVEAKPVMISNGKKELTGEIPLIRQVVASL